jgi:predicted RNase H-like nuclease (RuvC/YqgF family)
MHSHKSVGLSFVGRIERTAELEATVDSLKIQLQEQETEASEAIEQWQESYTLSEEKCTELAQELEKLKPSQEDTGNSTDSELQNLQELLEQKQSELDFTTKALENSKATIQELKGKLRRRKRFADFLFHCAFVPHNGTHCEYSPIMQIKCK